MRAHHGQVARWVPLQVRKWGYKGLGEQIRFSCQVRFNSYGGEAAELEAVGELEPRLVLEEQAELLQEKSKGPGGLDSRCLTTLVTRLAKRVRRQVRYKGRITRGR